MRSHLDPDMELKEAKLKRPMAVSLGCHGALFLLIGLWTWLQPPPFQFGDVDGDEGAAVAVNVVEGIPLNAPRAEENPVANPVEHTVPKVPEVEPPTRPEPAPAEEPEAVPVEEPKQKPAPKREEPKAPQKTEPEEKPNQVSSTTGARASSPLFSGAQTSAGGVGMRGSNPFGQGFGWYAEALQRKLAEEWRKTMGQVAGSTSQPVVVRFTILNDGRIQDIRVVESSGNRTLDYSAHRAVQYANPFQRLPPLLRRSSISVEMTFQLD